MRIIFTFIALSCFTAAHGQTYLGNSVDPVLLETATRLMERANETGANVPEKEKPTYYLTQDFYPATVVLATNKKYTNVRSRYDALHDVLEIQHEGRVYVLEGRKINTVVMNNAQGDSTRMIHARFVETDNKAGLYEVIVEGKKTLLKKTEVFVKKPDYVVQFNAGSKVTTYSLVPKYFLWKEDKTAEPLKCTRKGILTALDGQKDKMDAFIKNISGKITDEENLKSIFRYYNTL